MLIMILTFLLVSIIVFISMFAYAKYNAKKPQETEWRAATERRLTKKEKEMENGRRFEETGYSERDEREYEDEDSDNSDDGE